MLVKKILKISMVSASFFVLVACSTGNDELGERNLDTVQHSDKAITSGTGDSGSFYTDEINTNLLKVANQTYYFEFDKSTIESSAVASLKIQADYLINHPHAKILIAGHTDERGSREYNIGLGQRRALSVANFLQSNGVNKNQILTVSYGEEKPIAFGHSEADYSKNRRADLQYQTPIIMDKE